MRAGFDGQPAIVAAEVVDALREIGRRFVEQRMLGEGIDLPGLPRVEMPVRRVVAFDVSDVDVLGDAGTVQCCAKLFFGPKNNSDADTDDSSLAADFVHDGIHHSGRWNPPRLGRAARRWRRLTGFFSPYTSSRTARYGLYASLVMSSGGTPRGSWLCADEIVGVQPQASVKPQATAHLIACLIWPTPIRGRPCGGPARAAPGR